MVPGFHARILGNNPADPTSIDDKNSLRGKK